LAQARPARALPALALPAPPGPSRPATMLLQQILDACREQWPDFQWSKDQVEGVLNSSGQLFCNRLERALQLEGIVPDAKVTFKECGFHVYSQEVGMFQAGETLTFEGLAAQLASCCGQQPSQQIINEMRCCVMNDSMTTLFQRYVWHARDVGNLWRFVYDHQTEAHNSLDFWERFAAFRGHPTHVFSKSKLELASKMPLSFDKVCKYSPEFGHCVSLRLLAARRDLMVIFPSVEAWQGLWRSNHPDAVDLLAKEVGTASADEYVLLWVHPLNEENLREMLPLHFQEKSLRILDQNLAQGQPTLSFRTLAMAPGYYVKLPVPLQMTSWPRYVSPVEIQESAIISQLLPGLDLPTKLVMLLEAHTCHLSYEFTGGAASYQQARCCSMLVRDSAVPYMRDEHNLVPLAAAFSPTPAGCSLFEEIWVATGIGCDEILHWFTTYVRIIAECQITPFLRYGFTIEAHQQNGMIELTRDGWLTRLFCRETGGGIEWDLERLKAFPALDFSQQLYPRQDIFVSAEHCRNCLRHTMLESNLLPLAGICSSAFDIDMERLHEIIRSEVAATIESVRPSSDDLWSTNQFQDYASLLRSALFEEKSCERKALLRMRLEGTKDYIFVEHRNRLAL